MPDEALAYRVAWTESAWQELECAASLFARDSPRYATALVEEAGSAARSLRTFPNRGRVVPEVRDKAIRELRVKSYRMIYEVRSDSVIVLSFIHGARQLCSLQ